MGASWLTTVFGGLTILGSIMQLVAMTVEESGLPHDTSTWLNFATKITVGVGLILAKSFNVSNSPNPVAPVVVPETAATKPNPTANM